MCKLVSNQKPYYVNSEKKLVNRNLLSAIPLGSKDIHYIYGIFSFSWTAEILSIYLHG